MELKIPTSVSFNEIQNILTISQYSIQYRFVSLTALLCAMKSLKLLMIASSQSFQANLFYRLVGLN